MCYRERRKEKNKVKEIELLAPAGSFEKAKIAFLYGADAVYCGTASLSLRSRAEIQDDDLIQTIKYAHSIGKKVYVALNIYAWDETYPEIIEMAKKLEEIKPDGIIAADGGVIETLKQYAPSVPINVSTQANLVSLHSCNFWYKNGAKRMIMARELNKEQLKYIMANKPEGMEIEIFVHGAICFAYSGRCFLSDFLACRSANLGDCAQSCRWSYNLYAEERNNPGQYMPIEMDEHGTSIFSSKDLCLIRELPEIIDMGVDSVKIEGRLKTEYYVASIVNVYRNAIDDYKKDPSHYDVDKYLKEIEKIVKEKGKDHLNELEELCYVIEKGNECDRIKMTRVGQIMKEKYDKFMEDMNLREEAWAYEKAEFDKIAHYVDGEAKGKVEKSKSHVIKFYKMKYPNEDISWLENLTEKQYDEIFDMLLNNEDLEVIKRIIGK